MNRSASSLAASLAIGLAGVAGQSGAAQPYRLGAPPPSESDAEDQFDFWIGQWDVVQRHHRNSRWNDAPGSKLVVYPVIDGRVLIERFRGPTGGGTELYGFSMRAYDPIKEEWVVVLRWPGQGGSGTFWTMEGGFHHNRCEIFSDITDSQGLVITTRYTFSDAIDGYYRWNDGTSIDGGDTWATRFIMEGVRRDPDRDGQIDRRWLDGLDEPRNDGQEFKQLDFLEGTWTSEVEFHDADSGPIPSTIRISVQPIVGRAAQLMRYWRTAPDGSVTEAVLVQGYDASLQRWLAYQLDRHGRLRRYEGTLYNDGMVFLQTKEEGDERPLERLTWRRGESDTIVMKIELSPDDGVTWGPHFDGVFEATDPDETR